MSTFNPIFYYNIITASPSFKNLLIAAYKFEGNGNDSHTNAYNGTVGTATTFSTANAVDGLAGQFINNTTARITIPTLISSAFTFTTSTGIGNGVDKPFSIKANIRIINYSTLNGIFSKYSGANNNTSEYLFYVRTNGRLALLMLNRGTGTNYLLLETIATVPTGAVQNVIVTYDGSGTAAGIKFYVNNVLQSTNDVSVGTYLSMGSTALTPVIAASALGSVKLVGTIDELYIFNAALTVAQVATLQTNYYPNF
jgi:hypothetical protein